jgi:NADH-quinone oxidoreductase subunit C
LSSADEGTTATEEAPPTDDAREAVLAGFGEQLGDALVESHIAPGHGLWLRVQRDAWRTAAEVAKAKLGFTFFDFLSGIDWMVSPFGRYEDAVVDAGIPTADPSKTAGPGYAGGDARFQVFAHLLDVRSRHTGVFLKADLPDDDLRVASFVPVFAGAAWHERECWEMYGFTFDGHPGLRHLYLPGEFEGHPLRKDYPLLARVVKPWPGIVDVEPMPGEASENGDETQPGEPADAEDEAAIPEDDA